VAPTSGVVQKLEVSEIARSSNPHPQKRQRVDPEVEISLFCPSEEEDIDMFLEDAATTGPSGTSQRYIILYHASLKCDTDDSDAATNKQVVTKSPPSWTSSLQNDMWDEFCTSVNVVA